MKQMISETIHWLGVLTWMLFIIAIPVVFFISPLMLWAAVNDWSVEPNQRDATAFFVMSGLFTGLIGLVISSFISNKFLPEDL